MNFIKKIFDNRVDNSVHLQFQKFGKGEFKNRALIKAKRTKEKYSISTSAEFSNELVRIVAERLNKVPVMVTGCVVSTNDLSGRIEFKEKKQFQGVKRYIIGKEMNKIEILGLLDEFPESFFALSFEAPDIKLKIKPKAPKSGKPGKKEEKPKVDFCKIVTSDREIAGSFIFEKKGFKEASVSHTFLIESIEIPEELKKGNDFERIRKEAKRKGKIIRNAEIDWEIIKSEKEFLA